MSQILPKTKQIFLDILPKKKDDYGVVSATIRYDNFSFQSQSKEKLEGVRRKINFVNVFR